MSIYAMKKPKRINSVSVTVAIVLLIGGYFAYAFVPKYWPFFQMKGVLRGFCNKAYRDYQDDKKLVDELVKDTRRIKLSLSADNFEFEREPFDQEDFTGVSQARMEQMQQRGKTCVVRFYYEDEITLPIIDKPFTRSWESEVRVPLKNDGPLKGPFEDCSCVRSGADNGGAR